MIKYLLWKCLHNKLTSRCYIDHIGINIDPTCPVCKNDKETIEHTFTNCKQSSITRTQGVLMPLQIITLSHWPQNIKNLNNTTPSPYLTWKDLYPFVL